MFGKWLGPRSRRNYWSCTKFADWVRQKLGGQGKPKSETMEGWEQWRIDNQKTAKFAYWLTEELFDEVQDVVYLPYDIWHAIRYYLKNRFFDKLHYLPTRLKAGQYYDLDTRVLHALMEGLVDFVEIEKAHMMLWSTPKEERPVRYRFPFLRFSSIRSRELGMKHLEWEMSLAEPNIDEWGTDMSSPRQAATAKEIAEIYTWWKDVRPNRADPHDVTGWTEYCATHPMRETMSNGRDPEVHGTVTNMLRAIDTLEQKYDQEDEDMMIRLIKIRKGLWT